MRYVLFVAIVLLSVSCNKKKCWQCTQHTKTVTANRTVDNPASTSICDKTKSEIDETIAYHNYEKQMNDTTKVVNTFTCN